MWNVGGVEAGLPTACVFFGWSWVRIGAMWLRLIACERFVSRCGVLLVGKFWMIWWAAWFGCSCSAPSILVCIWFFAVATRWHCHLTWQNRAVKIIYCWEVEGSYQRSNPLNVVQIVTDNASNCKGAGYWKLNLVIYFGHHVLESCFEK